MKNKIFTLPLGLIVSITLWSFRPAPPSSGSVITLSNGMSIIPSSASISSNDQSAILSILQSYGSQAGYIVYKNSSNVTVTYNAPSSTTRLSELDSEYGSDLANGNSFSGYVAFVNTIGLDDVAGSWVSNSSVTTEIASKLAPILAKYQ